MVITLFGVILGFCFGLTGSGGSTLAVPLLVYGIGLAPHRAVCASMITIGTMAALRTVQKLRAREVEFRTGWVVAVAGLVGAPGGAWTGRWLPEKWLLLLFAGIVLVVAFRILIQDHAPSSPTSGHGVIVLPLQSGVPSSCPPVLAATSLLRLSATGLVTGFLAGLLGIGGGFVIVPALVLFCGLEIHRAIATSMFSIALISVAAMTAHWFSGQRPPLDVVAWFTFGAFLGLGPGSLLATRLSGPRLQRVFGLALVVLAAFILLRNVGAF